MSGEGDQVALASFMLMPVLAGGNAVAIRFSNRELDPLWHRPNGQVRCGGYRQRRRRCGRILGR